MKASVSNRIYIKCDKDEQERLKTHLTYKIEKYSMGQHYYETVRMWSKVSKDIISIPTGRFDLLDTDNIVDRRVLIPTYFPEFKFELRPDQQEIYDQVDDSCIINAQPSWGKTFTAIAIAKKLGQKTLIITHTVFLREQWEKEIEKTLGFKPSVIGSGKFEYDTPITVANVQTLTKKFDKVNKEFGTLVLDECHHSPASTFFKIIDASKARYKIGLSATLERKDGYHVMLPDVFSTKIYRPKVSNMMPPRILLIDTNIEFNSDNGIPWATRVTELLENPDYFTLLVHIVDIQVKKGHKVLVLADRNSVLYHAHEIFLETSAIAVGATSSEDRNNLEARLTNGEIDIVFGNMSIFKEGISIPPLSCLVLATPINNDPLLAQVVGRICRINENKQTPEVVDLQLRGRVGRKQANARLGFYLRSGWETRIIK